MAVSLQYQINIITTNSYFLLSQVGTELDAELIADILGRMILHWNYRNLKELPLELLQSGEHIREIYLKRNFLTSLPKDIGKLGSLTNLYLIGNQISLVPELPGTLKVLDLSQNLLQSVPPSIANIEGLEQLVITQNQLHSVSKELSRLKRLKFLELSGNQISFLPEELILGITSLEEFAIDGNPISHIPRCITKLKKLRYISACKCKLLHLPYLPFSMLVNGRRREGEGISYTSNNAVPLGSPEESSRLSGFQFLFDSNPTLNHVPKWVLDFWGTRGGVEAFGCGFLMQTHRGRGNVGNLCYKVVEDKDDNSSSSGPKLVLSLNGVNHKLCFEDDLMKIHTSGGGNKPSSLLEQSLRFVYDQDLHKEEKNTQTKEKGSTLSFTNNRNRTPVVEPLIKYSSRFNPKDMVMMMGTYPSASDTTTTIHDKQDENTKDDDGSSPSSHVPSSVLLPPNLKRMLVDLGPLARCFSCMKPIFTEAWVTVLARSRDEEENLFQRNGNRVNNEEDNPNPRNDDNIYISTTLHCSLSCRNSINSS